MPRPSGTSDRARERRHGIVVRSLDHQVASPSQAMVHIFGPQGARKLLLPFVDTHKN